MLLEEKNQIEQRSSRLVRGSGGAIDLGKNTQEGHFVSSTPGNHIKKKKNAISGLEGTHRKDVRFTTGEEGGINVRFSDNNVARWWLRLHVPVERRLSLSCAHIRNGSELML